MDPLLDMRMLAARLSVSYVTIKRLVAERRIGYVLIGTRKRFREQDIEIYLHNCQRPAGSLRLGRRGHAG